MIDKVFPDADAALAAVRDGATVMIGGFGGAGAALRRRRQGVAATA